MFGNVTALEGLHVIREIQELKYDARMLQAWRLVFSQHDRTRNKVPSEHWSPSGFCPSGTCL